MDIILFLLYLSVYLAIGGIVAELSLGYHDKKSLDVVRPTSRKAVYCIITTLWPFCFIMFLYEFFQNGGKR